MPCRRSWVRVPSSALPEAPETGAFCNQMWESEAAAASASASVADQPARSRVAPRVPSAPRPASRSSSRRPGTRVPRASRTRGCPARRGISQGGPGVMVLARRSAPRPARTISIIIRSRFERSCRWHGCDRRRVAIWWKCDAAPIACHLGAGALAAGRTTQWLTRGYAQHLVATADPD